MRIKIQNLWYRLRSSFLFLPALMTIGSIIVAFVFTAVDKMLADRLNMQHWLLYSGGSEGARTILSVISGSMITVAGVVFSITIVVLSLASSQFGPRLIRNFMDVRANQIVLGIFVATFTYCVLVMRTVSSTVDTGFVPNLSVTIAIIISLLSLGVLIYFIHSISESIQAQNIIARVHSDLDDAVNRIFPEKIGNDKVPSSDPSLRKYNIPTKCDDEACHILARGSGYLQAIDIDALMDLAVEENILIHLEHRPGNFITQGGVVATVWPGKKVDQKLSKKINSVLILGQEQTLEQDVEFAISQLAEIAVRALSSGVNDPITAITCIDWLGTSLCRIANRKIPSSHRYDKDSRLRIICKPFTFSGMVDAAFNMIRQNSMSVPAVSIHLLETIATIAAQTRNKHDHHVLLRHAEMINDGCKQRLTSDDDRNDLEKRYRAVVEIIDEQVEA